jgi:hypothetical protein
MSLGIHGIPTIPHKALMKAGSFASNVASITLQSMNCGFKGAISLQLSFEKVGIGACIFNFIAFYRIVAKSETYRRETMTIK